MADITGIYIIKNLINNKCYIGSSIHVHKRLTDHQSLLVRGKHHSYKLQGSYNKHGKENFKFELLEEVHFPNEYLKNLRQEYLECLEEYYINKYESYKKGYNVSEIPRIVGNNHTPESNAKAVQTRRGRDNYVISEITRQKRSESLKNSEFFKKQQKLGSLKRRKPIYQYDLKGNFIKEWKSIQELSSELGIFESMIRKSIFGQNHRCKNFIFSREKHSKILSYEERKLNTLPKSSRYIEVYNSDNVLIKTYLNYKECAIDLNMRSGTLASRLSRNMVCNNCKYKYGSAHR
jgi:group I intron endonuclease